MANQIAIDVYEFSTGMELAYKHTVPFVRENIVSYESASVYNWKKEHFPGVRSKISASWGGPVKDHFVAQTIAEIKALLDA